jgi:hypothetical protein
MFGDKEKRREGEGVEAEGREEKREEREEKK